MLLILVLGAWRTSTRPDARGAICRAERSRPRPPPCATLLRTEVLLGSYDERPLPDESALQRLHDASRGAIRAALALLRDEGLIERYQGSGTFVASQKTNHQFDELRALDTTGDGEQMTRDVNIDHATLSTEAVPADAVVAAAMHIDVGASLLRLERVVYLLGGRPLDFGIGRLRGDRVRLSSRLRRPGSDIH